jgi:hypothetical protein
MAAFRRRTVFAAPLIVIAGCGGKEPSPHSLGGPSWSVRKAGATCRADVRIDCPPDVACNPPAPREIACPPGATETTTIMVVEKSKNTCAIVPRGCSELSCATEATPCPTPYEVSEPPQKLVAIWSIQPGRTSPDSCEAYDELACSVPPGQPAPPCNPPPPRAVACPKGFVRDTAMRIGQRIDRSCAIAPAPCVDVTCVKEAIACPGSPPSPLDSRWRVKRDPKGECVAIVVMGCPNGPPLASCNPPPPRGNRLPPPTVLPIPCPAALGDKPELLFARFADMKCAIVDEDCRDASCAKEAAPCL